MGAALNAAAAMGAYTRSDRGTWLSFGNKGDMQIVVEGDPRLLNRYDVIVLNPQARIGQLLGDRDCAFGACAPSRRTSVRPVRLYVDARMAIAACRRRPITGRTSSLNL
jgi:hypothetical protein